MMILKKLCYGLSGSLFLASSLLTISSHAATDSIGLTVTTDVEMGTCTSTLTDDGTTKISTINFGDVYISEINAETKIKTFKLQFKDCAGIPGKKAKIKLTTRALCEGNSNNGPDLLTHQRQQQKQRRSPLRSGAHPHQVRTALNNSVVSPPQQKKSVLLMRRAAMLSITQ